MAQDARGLPRDAARPPVKPRGLRASGCCVTCHTRLAQIVALLEAQMVRAMPGHIPLTPEAYLEGLYQAAADRALTARG